MAPWLLQGSLVFQNNYHTWCITRFHHDLALSKTHPLKFLYSKCKCVALVFYQNSSHNGHQQHLPCLTNEAKPAIIRAFLAATGRSLAIHQSQQPVEFVVWEQSRVFLERQGMANHMYPYVMYLYWRFFSFWRPFMAKSTSGCGDEPRTTSSKWQCSVSIQDDFATCSDWQFTDQLRIKTLAQYFDTHEMLNACSIGIDSAVFLHWWY